MLPQRQLSCRSMQSTC